MEPTEIETLQINLADPDDIRAKLPQAQRLYKAKVDAAVRMRREAEYWGKLVASLGQIVGEDIDTLAIPGDSPPGITYGGLLQRLRSESAAPSVRKESPAQDRAIAGLARAGSPMGPTALYRFMESQGLEVPSNPNALGAALWNAAENGRIKKTPDGLYALLEWDTEQPELEDAATTQPSATPG